MRSGNESDGGCVDDGVMMIIMMSLINHKIKNTFLMLHKRELSNEFTVIYCSYN